MKQPKDPLRINDLRELEYEIARLKTDVKQQEKELEAKIKRIPAETLKATAGAALPVIVNATAASTAFSVVKKIWSFIRKRRKKGK